jgi:thiol:disulfide interchange protein DsbA
MKSLIAAFFILFAVSANAAPQAGFEYLQTQQVIPGDDPGKVEVIELFWYGCPHCYHLEPRLAVWVKSLPKDVVFKRVPGIARPDWAAGGKAYFTLEALGLVDKLHVPLFDAIHKQKSLKPNDDAGLIDWITKQSGLDKKKIQETYNSFSVSTKVSRAMQVFRSSGATGVPALIVDGKHLTSSTIAGGNEQALKVADYLIGQARTEKGLK